jgi:hypothetical protein
VGQVGDKKDTLSKTKAVGAVEAIHVRNYNPRIPLRYSTHCRAGDQALDSSTNFPEADQEADHSLHSSSYSSYIPAEADFAGAGHSSRHTLAAVGVAVRISGWNNRTSTEAVGEKGAVGVAAEEGEGNAGDAGGDVACEAAAAAAAAAVADEAVEDIEHAGVDVEHTEDAAAHVEDAGAGAGVDARTDHNLLASAVEVAVEAALPIRSKGTAHKMIEVAH